MEELTPRAFQKAAKEGKLCGNYLFFGEEDYLKSHALSLARDTLFPEDDPFNHTKISAEDASWLDTLEEQAMSLPMFAEQKLTELHSVNYTKLAPRDLERLAAILNDNAGQRENVIVLYAGAEDFDPGTAKAPSAAYKALSAVAVPVRFAYEGEYNLVSWVIRHFSANGVGCSPAAASAVIAFCSKDMLALSSEVDKLSFYTLAAGRKEVEPRDIPEVCCGKNIEGAFDFTDALMSGDSGKAARLLSSMKARKERPEIVLAGVTDTLSKMYIVRVLAGEGMDDKTIAQKTGVHPYRVSMLRKAGAGKSAGRLEKALELCLEADLKIKNTGLDDYAVLERLVMRLCRV